MRTKSENADLASQLLDVQDQMDNMNEDYERLKNVEVQYDSLKLKLDFMESEKQVTQDYENFQNLNHDMQEEIISLRSYINQQQMVNSALQQQIQTSGENFFKVDLFQKSTSFGLISTTFEFCRQNDMQFFTKECLT